MTVKDGGAAFPFSPPVDDTGRSAVGYPFPELGMSLRDWFAGQAMAAFIRRAVTTEDWGRLPLASYEIADAMLEARK